MLNIENNSPENQIICKFEGRLDTLICLKLAEELNMLTTKLKSGVESGAHPDQSIIFDLEKVNYISSSFIRICISTAKQFQKGQFLIMNCDPFIKRTFKIAGLDELFNIS